MPRLYHTKSRTGCVRCRARRVKGKCQRHQVECVYDRKPKAESPCTNSSCRSQSQGASDAGRGSFAETRERRYRELRLLHIFTTEICPTLAGTHQPDLFHLWTVDVPRLALTYEPLFNSLMAVSCLYMATMVPDAEQTPQELMTHRAAYLEATMNQHRQLISGMTPETADATCFASMALTVDAFASLLERQLEPYEPPLPWLHMSRGLSSVFGVAMNLVKDYPDAIIHHLFGTTVARGMADKATFEANLEGFRHLLEPRDEVLNEEDLEAYKNVVSYIGSVKNAHAAGEHPKTICRRLTAWATMSPARYIELLGLRRPRALVLLAHFFGLACYVNQFWWIGWTPVREIRAIEANLSPVWMDLLAWPLQAALERASTSPYASPLAFQWNNS